MNDKVAWRNSKNVVGVVLAILVVLEVVFLLSDLPDGVRRALSGAAAIALVLAVTRLSANRRRGTTGR